MTENRETHKISCENLTYVFKNTALEENYPGGLSAFVEKYSPTVNNNICVLCFRCYEDSDGLFDDLVASEMYPGDDYTNFFVYNEMPNQSIDTKVTWLQCTDNDENAYVWYVEYPGQYPLSPIGESKYKDFLEEDNKPWERLIESIKLGVELSLVLYRPEGPPYYSHCVFSLFGLYWLIDYSSEWFVNGPYRNLLDVIAKDKISVTDSTANIWCKELSTAEILKHISTRDLKSEITIPVNGELRRIFPDRTLTVLQS